MISNIASPGGLPTSTSAVPDNLDLNLWQSPPVGFRPAPLWTWNEAQEPEELKRQIRDMKEQGFGGFFMHARTGLKTPYMGEQWLQDVKLCVEEAKQNGLHAWLYDEERWPSGYAGGEIAEVPGLDYAAYALSCKEENGERHFEIIRSKPSVMYNNVSVQDSLNPQVIAAFIELAHGKYEQHVGTEFGQNIPGTMTDEPSYVLWDRRDPFDVLPWTADFEAIFQEKRGYDLRPHLASLFFDEGDYRRIRLDYYRTVTDRFMESTTRQLFEWCGQHQLRSVGHMMMEDHMLNQVRAVGACMPHYEWFHWPGIDHLGKDLYGPIFQKQCTSVADQLGKERIFSESFGAGGWESKIWQFKTAGDRDFAYGINFLNQHMMLYSVRGCRKRDYPPSCSYHVPGFELYRSFNEYFARLSYALTRGQAKRRILVLHPIYSAWTLYSPQNTAPVVALDEKFQSLSTALLEIQRDYDYGDEILLEKYGSVAEAKFIVGQGEYEAVVIPSAENWSTHTLTLLQEFAKQGGKIVAVEPVAQFVDGAESPTLAEFFNHDAVTRVASGEPGVLDSALAQVPRDVHVTLPNGALVRDLVYQRRHLEDGRELYFLSFSPAQESFDATISLEGKGAIELWDARSGTAEPVGATSTQGRTEFERNIAAQDSLFFVLDPASTLVAPTQHKTREMKLDKSWVVTRQDENVLLLDRAQLKLGSSPWTAPMGVAGIVALAEVPNIQDAIGSAVEKKFLPPTPDARLRFQFEVRVENAAQIQAAFVIEDERAMNEISINGTLVDSNGWWLDRGFPRFDVTGLLYEGTNVVQCRAHWSQPQEPGTHRFIPGNTELDNCYLVGDFSVEPDANGTMIVVAPSTLPDDPETNLAHKGLPFYAGRISYQNTIEVDDFDSNKNYVLRFAPPEGDGLRVLINGQHAADLFGSPFEVDATSHLCAGKNQIEVVLFASLGNVLGAVRHNFPWFDPAHLLEQYALKPLHLGQAKLRVTDG